MDEPRSAREIFEAVFDLPPAERAAWLDQHCPPELRTEVDELLARHEPGPTKLFAPALEQLARNVTPADRLEFEQLDEFRIIGRLGEGGMGVVYLAQDELLHRLVALKVLPREYTRSEVRVARFRHEAILVAQLRYPGIVPVYKVGEAEGVHYLAMEVVDGPTLEASLDALRHQDESTRLRTIRGEKYIDEQLKLLALVADALHYTHEHEIVHRDVKPSNILLDRDGAPRLTDFGIAKNLAEPDVTAPGSRSGTVPYMSPEQALASGARIDRRTDIFSLGVVLYELLTLQRPFTGETNEEIIHNLILKQPQRLRSVNPAVTRDLETVCDKALEKDPAHRYQTAAHLAGDLQCVVARRPIMARRPSTWRRLRVWARDHRVAALAASVGLLVIVVGALLLYEVGRYRAARVAVRLESTAPEIDDGARVISQLVDEQTLELGAPELAGEIPLRTFIAPGQYRFTVVRDAGAFHELTVFADVPGTEVNLRFSIPGDRQALSAGMIAVAGGSFVFGRPDRIGFDSQRSVALAPFLVDRHEVSNAEYRAFVDATGRPVPTAWQDRFGGYPEGLDDYPIVGITWHDAQAYARWAGKRLLTVFEWESAARAPLGAAQPWPDDAPDDLVLVSDDDRPIAGLPEWPTQIDLYRRYARPVNGQPDLATPLGLHHMASNVMEYTDSRNTLRGAAHEVIIKGASWLESPDVYDLTSTWTRPMAGKALNVGFRCGVSAQAVSAERSE